MNSGYSFPLLIEGGVVSLNIPQTKHRAIKVKSEID